MRFLKSTCAMSALLVAATGAQADELTTLKAQLETLQSRVNQLESTPATAAIPDGSSQITFKRGQGSLADWNMERRSEINPSKDGGFTIAITPTADIPAPVTEVTVGGFVKADVIYDFDQDNMGDTFGAGAYIFDGSQNVSGVSLHARQTRFRIKSRSDTAVGQIRTLIETDFFGTGNTLRLRHAWGEWDMTPNWTLGAGQTWRIGCDIHTGITTVDFGASAGQCYNTRGAQVRLTYANGPLTFAFGIQEPLHRSGAVTQTTTREAHVPAVADDLATTDVDESADAYWGTTTTTANSGVVGSSPDFPNFAASLLYAAPGGHQLFVSGELSHIDIDGDENLGIDDDGIGWQVQAGTNIALGDLATFTGHVQYGDGISDVNGVGGAGFGMEQSIFVNDATTPNPNSPGDSDSGESLSTFESWGFAAGLSVNATDTTQINVQYGRGTAVDCVAACAYDAVNTIHANVLWKPVNQMRLGWEVIYGWKEMENAPDEDALRGQFGAWFSF